MIWTNFGSYHQARINALARRQDVSAIELAQHESLYGWNSRSSSVNAEVVTLENCEWERVSHIKVAVRLWRVLEKTKPDVILVPGYATLPALCATLWATLRGVPAILMSESNAHDHARAAWKESLKRSVVRRCFGRAIVGGKSAADYATSLGIDGGKIGKFYDVVDNDFFSRGIAYLRATDSNLREKDGEYFLYVGRFAAEKNLAGLLMAYRQYLELGGDWGLVLVGDGPLGAEVARDVQSLGLSDKILLPGFREAEGLLPFYARASCFVLASLREPWGLVVNEAMASGLPVLVSSRCGCAPDLVVAGENGYVFDPLDQHGLAELLLRIDRMGEAQRQRMGARSGEIIARYSPEAFAAEVERVLNT